MPVGNQQYRHIPNAVILPIYAEKKIFTSFSDRKREIMTHRHLKNSMRVQCGEWLIWKGSPESDDVETKLTYRVVKSGFNPRRAA